MSPQRKVLCVGIDVQLLAVRRRLLESQGYAVVCCHCDGPALDLLLTGEFDLTIVCHSVQGQRLRTLLAKLGPAPVLLLKKANVQPVILLAEVDGHFRQAGSPAAAMKQPPA